nr:aminotransferase class I/II-fold pyridoxal phosphate-dependent enzyme [Desulfovibrio sp.]
PSGYCPKPAEVRALAERLPAGCLLVVDEAYIDFAPEEGESEDDWSLLHAGDCPANVAFIRTFSKCYGLAGLRIGIGILPGNLASYYWRMRLPFSLNILAEEAALTALDDGDFREATLSCVREGRKALFDGLGALGCTVYPSRANFLMFTPPQGIEANDVYVGLLKKGVIVRALKSYEMPWNIRVSVGSPRENRLFLDGMRELLGKGA